MNKDTLFKIKYNLLFKKELFTKKITIIEDEIMNRLKNIYFCGYPLYFNLAYLKPTVGQSGKCDDQSRFLSFGFDRATLVTGDLKSLQIEYGQANGMHWWIEYNNYVYDPSLLLRIDKELYYKMHEPTNIKYFEYEDYSKSDWYQDIINTTIEDIKPNGKKRGELELSAPIVLEIANMQNNEKFINEFNDFLNEVDYNNKINIVVFK